MPVLSFEAWVQDSLYWRGVQWCSASHSLSLYKSAISLLGFLQTSSVQTSCVLKLTLSEPLYHGNLWYMKYRVNAVNKATFLLLSSIRFHFRENGGKYEFHVLLNKSILYHWTDPLPKGWYVSPFWWTIFCIFHSALYKMIRTTFKGGIFCCPLVPHILKSDSCCWDSGNNLLEARN